MTARPYLKLRFEALKTLTEQHWHSKAQLEILFRELECRSTRFAIALKGQVKARMRELDKIDADARRGPSSGRSRKSVVPRPVLMRPDHDSDGEGKPAPELEEAVARGESVGRLSEVTRWDAKQRGVVSAASGARVLVAAGPGTGKTEVACGRVAHLLKEGCDPSNIWLISFTRTAVKELGNRIKTMGRTPEEVGALRVATLDSTSWRLLNGVSPEAARKLQGHGQTIRQVIDLLRSRDRDVIEFLGGVVHLLVDEAQDVIGPRADLLCELIMLLPKGAGVTVLTDDAQAIYGFTDDDPVADNAPPDNLPARIRQKVIRGFVEETLLTIHRTDKRSLLRVFSEARSHAIKAHLDPEGSYSRVRTVIEAAADARLGSIQEQALGGRDDVLVLYRTRAEVLSACSYLWSDGIPHRVRMSGTPECIHPWVGVVLWDFTGSWLTEAKFAEHWARAESHPALKGWDPDRAWRALFQTAGEGARGVRMETLRSRLSTSPPVELLVPELGYRGPIVGTIHASKGREAHEVHLMLPVGSPLAGAAGEARVAFVGATRAKRALRVGSSRSLGVRRLPSGRLFRWIRAKGKLKYRAQVELGRDRDVDTAAAVTRAFFSRDEALAIQALLRANAVAHFPVTLVARAEWAYRYLIARTDDEGTSSPVGLAAKSLGAEMFDVAEALWPNVKLKPPPELRHLRFIGARSVALKGGDLDGLVPPFNASGIFLAPLVTGFTTIPFFHYGSRNG